MHALRHDEVIVGDHDLAAVSQAEAAAPTQITTLGITARTALLSRLAELFQLPRNLFEPPSPISWCRRNTAARIFVTIALLLSTPDSLPHASPLAT